MKKIIFITAAFATLMFTNCKESVETLTTINFNTKTEISTRATDVVTADLTNLHVETWYADGDKFRDFELEKVGNEWIYGEVSYHPVIDLYHFSTLPDYDYTFNTDGISFTYQANKDEDLIGVGITSTQANSNNILLTYNHLLSKINFEVLELKTSLGNGWNEAGLEDIKIVGIKDTGVVNIDKDNNLSWTSLSGESTYIYNYDRNKDVVTTESLMLVPQEFEDAYLSFTIWAKHDNSDKRTIEKDVQVLLSDIKSNHKWEPGKSYLYTFNFKDFIENEIDNISKAFDVILTEWGDTEEIVVNIPK